MPTEMAFMTTEESDLIAQAQECASHHFRQLVNLTDADMKYLRRRTEELRRPVGECIPEVQDKNRITTNYCLAIAATEIVSKPTCNRL